MNIGIDIDDNNNQHTRDFFGWSRSEEIEFWTMFGDTILLLPPRIDAINFVRREIPNNKMYFISARTSGGVQRTMSIQKYTETYFKRYDIPYTKISTDIKDKKDYCSLHEIEIFIDDSIANCESVANLNIPVFLNTTDMNRDKLTRKANIKRISSFDEIIL